MFAGVVTGDIHSLIETTDKLSRVTSRQQSEDSIHKQLAAFERLLQHAMSRYSNERLFNFLCLIVHHVESRDKPEENKNKSSGKQFFKLKSIKQLQEIVDDIKQNGKLKSDRDKMAKTFDLFLNDLLYLKDLKKYFDDEIYSALMKYHYEDTVEENSTAANKNKQSVPYSKKVGHDNTLKGGTRTPDQDARKFTYTVKELKLILDKWDGLLTHDAFDLNHFDPDSYHELMQFSGYSQFEAILRLVPDLFAKCYKCIELAKTWLTLANIVLGELQVEPVEEKKDPVEDIKSETSNLTTSSEDSEAVAKAEEEFWREVKTIQGQINDVTKSIAEDEKKLQQYQEEMDALLDRDERFANVALKVEEIASLITIATGEFQKTKTEQVAVADKMKAHKKHTPDYDELKTHLKRLDTQVAQKHWKVKQLEFEQEMVTEDYLVEIELRPSFIRFMGDTREKILDLERYLEVKRDEKLKLEKQLVLMKTNTERMREIMRMYLESASTSVKTDSLSRESSMTSSAAESDGSENTRASSRASKTETKEKQSKPSTAENGPESVELMGNSDAVRKVRCKSGVILQKPKLAKKESRPQSERTPANVSKPPTPGRVVKVGPKPALKTTPKRVWENV